MAESTTPQLSSSYKDVPAKYSLFDGFRRASTPMKFVYLLGIPATFGLLPLGMEVFRKLESNQAASKVLEESINLGLVTAAPSPTPAPELAQAPAAEHAAGIPTANVPNASNAPPNEPVAKAAGTEQQHAAAPVQAAGH